MSTGPSKLRIINDRAALSHILRAGEISRAELEDLTGLSKPATADLLSRLESAGLVQKQGMRSGGPGPKAQLWGVRPEVGFAAGVNVTPANIDVQITDLSGNVVSQHQFAACASAGSGVRRAIQAACITAKISEQQILHTVIGLPGALDPRSGMLKFAPHMPAWSNYDLIAALDLELDMPVTVENDVNLMALAELDGGLAAAAENFALVWIDTGLGAAIVIRRELFRGFTGGAGEIDYLPVPDRAEAETGLDRRGGKFGNLLSPQAIAALARAHGLPGDDPVETLRTAARTGSASGHAAFLNDLALRIATGLSAIVTVLDPELLLLGGAFGVAGGEPLAQLVRENLGEVMNAPHGSTAEVLALGVPSPTGPNRQAKPVDGAPVEGIPAGNALAGASSLALKHAREKAFETGSVMTS
ncbi:MAG: ROK family transcriptional regulator [Renibacterium sp.]|nr:ROK family transcriptional regulator [Renibacterium sp.]